MNSSSATRHIRILVVDDHPDTVVGTVLELKARSFDVDEVGTQEQAQALLTKCKYDALVLDLRLPKAQVDEPIDDPPLAENGVEILRSLLRGHFEPGGTQRGTAVFVFTALGPDSEFVNEVRKLGVRAVFGKPASPIFVAETIRLTLEGQ